MFCGCSSLVELNLYNFNTDKVVEMDSLFKGCKSLKDLNISHFETYKVVNMNFMLNGCSSLINLIMPDLEMFNNCKTEKITEGCQEIIIETIKSKIFYLDIEFQNNDYLNYNYLKSLENQQQKFYLGVYIYDKIGELPIKYFNNLNSYIIGKIEGMLLDINDNDVIFGIAIDNEELTYYIQECLRLLKENGFIREDDIF